MRTNRNLAKQFEKTYPQTKYYLQTLLVNSSKYLKADEKRNAFTGQNNDEKYLSLVLSNVEKLIEYMYHEAVFSNISSKEDVLDVMNTIIDRYELIYPNWKNEYYFLRQLIFNEEVFYDAYSNTINTLISAFSKQPSTLKSSNKHSLDTLVFTSNNEYQNYPSSIEDKEAYLKNYLKNGTSISNEQDSGGSNFFIWIIIAVVIALILYAM